MDKLPLHVTMELFPLKIAYGNFTFEKGRLAITSELAASSGKFTGYIKPLSDATAVSTSARPNQPFEGSLGKHRPRVSRVFRNQPKNRIATKYRSPEQ